VLLVQSRSSSLRRHDPDQVLTVGGGVAALSAHGLPCTFNGSFGVVPVERLASAQLYFITDLRPETERTVEAVLENGVDLVQLRDHKASDSELLAAGRKLAGLCHEHGGLFLVNDRPDIAVGCDADGVHLGQEDMPVDEAREIVGPKRLIGHSTHSVAQIEAAKGVDYISVGPVWETPTKEGRPAVGLEILTYAAENAAFPFFAIGGIDVVRAPQVVEAGATRIAVVRALRDASDPGEAARALIAALTRA
jgi:thiamine-phosphate pyrophosphorylase